MNKIDILLEKIVEKSFDIVQERIETGPSETYDTLYKTFIPQIKKAVCKELIKVLPREKKVLWPQNGCDKDCKVCKIEAENFNQAVSDCKQAIKAFLEK